LSGRLLIELEGLLRIFRGAAESGEEINAESCESGSCRSAGDVPDMLVQAAILVDHEDAGQRLRVNRTSLMRENRASFTGKFDLMNYLQVLGILRDGHVFGATTQLF